MNKVPFRFSGRPELRLRHERQRDLLGNADARGNNPHGTREPAEAEGRRLNAQRYESAAQMDRALDPQLGAVNAQVPADSGFWVKTGLLALAVGVAYLLGQRSSPVDAVDDVDEGDELEEQPRQLRVNPAPAPIVLRIEAPARLLSPVVEAPVPAVPVVPAIVPVVETVTVEKPLEIVVEKPKRKRKFSPNKGQFTSRTGRAARKLVERPGPTPKTAVAP